MAVKRRKFKLSEKQRKIFEDQVLLKVTVDARRFRSETNIQIRVSGAIWGDLNDEVKRIEKQYKNELASTKTLDKKLQVDTADDLRKQFVADMGILRRAMQKIENELEANFQAEVKKRAKADVIKPIVRQYIKMFHLPKPRVLPKEKRPTKIDMKDIDRKIFTNKGIRVSALDISESIADDVQYAVDGLVEYFIDATAKELTTLINKLNAKSTRRGLGIYKDEYDQPLKDAVVKVETRNDPHNQNTLVTRIFVEHKSPSGVNVFDLLDAGVGERKVRTGGPAERKARRKKHQGDFIFFPMYTGNLTVPNQLVLNTVQLKVGKPSISNVKLVEYKARVYKKKNKDPAEVRIKWVRFRRGKRVKPNKPRNYYERIKRKVFNSYRQRISKIFGPENAKLFVTKIQVYERRMNPKVPSATMENRREARARYLKHKNRIDAHKNP